MNLGIDIFKEIIPPSRNEPGLPGPSRSMGETMENQNIARLMEEGAAFFPAEKAGRRPVWYSNPAWTGVALADLAPGADTKGGSFSSHLVRVRKDCEVPDHLHESQWEWNAILAGHGR
ncbi:hypothetical protein [Methanoculleus chikugoensis]|uniref:hypothetical protein n=1 Tax=Methanoculleus chikugoensis TaxID=118126 RepID=UPI000AAFD7FB|nr:hypothetical protein [Methanoculleus chikugoensis]